jgi:hypothetical protein
MKKTEEIVSYRRLLVASFSLVLLTIVAKAQTNALNPSFDLSNGLQLDSPRVKLAWGSPMPDSTRYPHYRVRRIFPGSMVVSEWDSVRIFGIPIDSIFFHHVIPPNTPPQWRGMHSVYLFFGPDYTDQMVAIFDQLFGPARKVRRGRKRFVYQWYSKNFRAFISNRKHFDVGANGHVVAYIGIPHFVN